MARHRHEVKPHSEEFVVVDEYVFRDDALHHEPIRQHNGEWRRGWWITVCRLYCMCSGCEEPLLKAHSIVFCNGKTGIVFKWDHAPTDKMTESEADFLAGLIDEHKGLEEED